MQIIIAQLPTLMPQHNKMLLRQMLFEVGSSKGAGFHPHLQ
jgi:hypothetical protein